MGTVVNPPDALAVPSRHIAGQGTSEWVWQAWDGLRGMPAIDVLALGDPAARTIVVAPHPDDEVLGCGGLISMLAAQGIPCRVVAVTDGGASHPDSTLWSPAQLARRRKGESLEGLRRLGLRPDARIDVGLPDGGVRAHQAALVDALHGLLREGDTVVSTWHLDGHPDHDAVGEVTALACERAGCRHVEMPVWMWHWATPADPRVPWSRMRRLPLSAPALSAKARAIAAHATQLSPRDGGAPAVLPPWALDRLLRRDEYFILPEPRA